MRGYWRRSWFATKSAWSRSRKTFARLWSVEKCDCDPSNHPTTDVSNLFRSVIMYMGSLATYMVLWGADTRDVDFNCKRPILPRDDLPRRRGRQSCCEWSEISVSRTSGAWPSCAGPGQRRLQSRSQPKQKLRLGSRGERLACR